MLFMEVSKMKPKRRRKKSLVGWTWKGWSLHRGVGDEINHSTIYKTKDDSGEQQPTKVRITIEEISQ